MRDSLVRALLLVVLVCVGGDSIGEPLRYEATLSIRWNDSPPFQTSVIGITDVEQDGSFELPASILHLSASLLLPASPFKPFKKIALSAGNGTGVFDGPQAPGGAMPILGKATFFQRDDVFFYPDFTLPVSAPFSGLVTFTTFTAMSTQTRTYQLTGDTSRWKAGPVTLMGTRPDGQPFTRMSTGFDDRTAMGLGSMNLVIPIAFQQLRNGLLYETIPLSGRIDVTFTPEPATAALGAVAIAIVGLLGARSGRASRKRDASARR